MDGFPMMTLERQKTPFRAGEVMAALLLVQPLLDVLSYFMQEAGTTAFTTALRMVLLAAVSLYGFVITDRKKPVLALYAVALAFWVIHMIGCFRQGYQDPVGDAAEYLKLLQFPLWTAAFSAMLRQGQDLDRRAVACLVGDFLLILFIIALSFGLGMPVYTYDYPDRGIQLGILGWFGVANAQSAIVLVLGAPLLLWGYRSGKLWVFTLCAAGGFSLLYFTGTRLTYFGAILLAGGFFVLVLLGRKRWVFCLPLAVALALLVAFQGMSPMAARQAMSVDSYSYYEELTQQYLGEDSDFVYQEGEEIPPEILEKIRALYTEVYGKRGIYNTMLLGDLIQEFGVDRVMEEYGYTVDGELLYDVRDKKLHALHLVWEDQDLFTHLFGFEYAKAQIGVTNYDPENDFPALRYFYGYVGAALYVGYCLYFPLLALWHLVRKLRSFFSYPWVEAGTYLAMLAFGFGAAQFSGQVLRKPSVTVYLSLAAALLLGLFSREREPLEKGKEPVVLPGKM